MSIHAFFALNFEISEVSASFEVLSSKFQVRWPIDSVQRLPADLEREPFDSIYVALRKNDWNGQSLVLRRVGLVWIVVKAGIYTSN